MQKRNRNFDVCHEAKRQIRREWKSGWKGQTAFNDQGMTVMLGAIVAFAVAVTIAEFAEMVATAGPQIG